MRQKRLIHKDIQGFESSYSVTNHGTVFSKRRNKFRALPTTWGYPAVNLREIDKKRDVAVHRLVAEAFIPNPNQYNVINHKNGIKTDNRVENLEWVTQKTNVQHSVIHRHHKTKLSPVKVKNLRKRYAQGESTDKLAKYYKVHENSIQAVLRGITWSFIK